MKTVVHASKTQQVRAFEVAWLSYPPNSATGLHDLARLLQLSGVPEPQFFIVTGKIATRFCYVIQSVQLNYSLSNMESKSILALTCCLFWSGYAQAFSENYVRDLIKELEKKFEAKINDTQDFCAEKFLTKSEFQEFVAKLNEEPLGK